MKIFTALFTSLNAGKTINPAKLANAKKQLATLSQTDLLAVMDREARKTSDLAAKLGLRKAVPTVVQALADMHKEAVYVRHGQPAPQTIFVDVWRNAFAYVNKRNQVQKAPVFDAISSARNEALALSFGQLNTEKQQDAGATTLYGQARIGHTLKMMEDWRQEHGDVPMVRGGAKMSNLQYHIEAQKMLGEKFVSEWAGMAKQKDGKKVRFANIDSAESIELAATTKQKVVKKVRFARTDSSDSIERGGLAFDGANPVSVEGLIGKLAKVEGKKADR